jgi:hypothetical protein
MRAIAGSLVTAILALSATACGSSGDPSPPSTGLPLTDLGPSTYLDTYPGGLYPNGLNVVPSTHDSVGQARAALIQPRAANGTPSPGGKYVLLSIGMSNTSQEWCGILPTPCNAWTLMGQAAADGAVNHATLVIVNGAEGGEDARKWDSPSDPNYDRVESQVLQPMGLSELQVQAVWLKEANIGPSGSLPSASADAYLLEESLGDIVRSLKVRYPNLQVVFVSSRIYGGYATTGRNPEPFAYESGFSVKWLIEAQIDQMANGGTVVDTRAGILNYNSVAPWIGWGPYLWADGEDPRSDGLTWSLNEFESDGVHPNTAGETKVANRLLAFFKSSVYASCWFLAGGSCP